MVDKLSWGNGTSLGYEVVSSAKFHHYHGMIDLVLFPGLACQTMCWIWYYPIIRVLLLTVMTSKQRLFGANQVRFCSVTSLHFTLKDEGIDLCPENVFPMQFSCMVKIPSVVDMILLGLTILYIK